MNLLFFYLFSIFIAYVFLFLSIFYSFFAKSYIFYYDNVGPLYTSHDVKGFPIGSFLECIVVERANDAAV